MSLIIKGMELPSCCLMCPMYTISGCRASKRIFPDWMNVAAVPKDCPLVSLPEKHGRLVDADRYRVILCRLRERLDDDVAVHAVGWAIEVLDKLEAIVDEEEGGGEDG